MTTSFKCIYCLEEKDKAAFKKTEHVMPQSFGRFKANLTLIETVCDGCNHYFGNNLELDLGRGTWEGLSRYTHGVKSPEQYKSHGVRNKLTFKIKEGKLKGAYATLKYSEEMQQLVVAPLTQIGFFKKSDPSYDFFLLNEVPEKKHLEQGGFDLISPRGIVIFGDLSPARETLKEKGIPFAVGKEENPIAPGTQSLLTEISWTADDLIHRVIAKIAFNYLAKQQGKSFVLLSDFDPVRSYIRYGAKLDQPFLMPSNDPIFTDEGIEGKRRVGHVLIAGSNGNLTLAQVAFFNDIVYRMILARHSSTQRGFKGGHFFNMADLTVMPLPVVAKKHIKR